MAYEETFPQYKVVLELKPSFATAYKKIAEFNKTYADTLIRIYSLSEPLRVTQFEFNGSVYSRELNSYQKDGVAIEEKVYASSIEAYREDELVKLNTKRDELLGMLHYSGVNSSNVKYNYQLPTLRNEIMNQMNTYAPKHKRAYTSDDNGNYTRCQDIFYFDDTIVPMNIFAFLRKEYPCFMECIDAFYLANENDEILINFKSLNV